MITEKQLIRRFHQGDVRALRTIYDLYKHDLVTLAFALLCRKALAEDVVHDVFAKLLDNAQQIRIKGSLRGYLLTAVANTARNRNREPWVSRPTDREGRHRAESPERLVAQKERHERLRHALGQLPYEQREVILLHCYANERFRSIAKQLRISINTVQGRYRYGLQKLRSLLDGEK
ncbi:RNA polymerase sigma factor [Planctomycetota bacterium]